MEDLDLEEFLDDFRAEAAEHLRALDAQLLALERDPSDQRPVREMFLSAHTIKGGAGLLDLSDVQTLAHALEDVLGALRDQRRPLDTATADLLFQAADRLRELIGSSRPGRPAGGPADAELAAALIRQAEARAAVPPPPPAPPKRAAAPSAPRALLVEDSATVRLLESMLLSDAGFQVDAVADGIEALLMALQEPYLLVVTGIETRGMRGLDLAAALHAAPLPTPPSVIVMSSDDNPEHRRRAAEIGVHAYIRKGSFGQQRLADAARALAAGRPG